MGVQKLIDVLGRENNDRKLIAASPTENDRLLTIFIATAKSEIEKIGATQTGIVGADDKSTGSQYKEQWATNDVDPEVFFSPHERAFCENPRRNNER
jgi:hypothetical protein